jgi:hypothetical protein
MKITIELDDEEVKVLKKRAKKNLMELKEMVEDIIRRSCISAKLKQGYSSEKCDDKLVGIFSRQTRGRKRG